MSTTLLSPQLQEGSDGASIQLQVATMIDDLIAQLPNPEQLTDEERRRIIARYTAVLEGNFIYWMTATYLATHSEEARQILIDNLMEEVRDSHPVMLRKFTMEANAFPSSEDVLAVHDTMTKMRLFLGKLQGVQSLLTMAFFEGFIQKYMPFLAALAAARGSAEMEYTDVHGVCDVAHSEGLFRAVLLENSINPINPEANLFEGVELLRDVIHSVMQAPETELAAA
jgi:Iron-containing redox enzyme